MAKIVNVKSYKVRGYTRKKNVKGYTVKGYRRKKN